MIMDYEKIGNTLRVLRIQKGLSSEKVGEYTDIPFKSISHYENGRNIPLKNLVQLCKYYSVSIDDVINKKAELTIVFKP